MSRIGIQKFQIPTSGFLPSTLLSGTPTSSTVINASDWDSARVYFTYTVANGTCAAALQIQVTPVNGGDTFYQVGSTLTTTAGVTTTSFIDVDVTKVADLKFVATETGNTGAPGTIQANLVLRQNRASAYENSIALLEGFNRLMPTSTFTASNGGGSANSTTGIVSLPNGVATSTFASTPKLGRTHDGDPFRFSCAVQIKAFTSGTGAQQAVFTAGHDGTNSILIGTGGVATIRVWNNGFVDCFSNSSATVVSLPAGSALLDGQDYLKIDCVSGFVSFYFGRGTSLEAVNWIFLGSSTTPGRLNQKQRNSSLNVFMGLCSAPGPVGTCSVQFGDVFWRDLP